MREQRPQQVRSPRRQHKRDARSFVEQATGKPVSWKAARKWLKKAARRGAA